MQSLADYYTKKYGYVPEIRVTTRKVGKDLYSSLITIDNKSFLGPVRVTKELSVEACAEYILSHRTNCL